MYEFLDNKNALEVYEAYRSYVKDMSLARVESVCSTTRFKLKQRKILYKTTCRQHYSNYKPLKV